MNKNKFKIGDLLLCTDNALYYDKSLQHSITVGKKYRCLDVEDNKRLIPIINDLGKIYMYNKIRFKVCKLVLNNNVKVI